MHCQLVSPGDVGHTSVWPGELIERLSPEDAESLEIEPDRMQYELLAELSTATEKARRDAPSIAVCEL
jgi:hypothetical protein